MNDLVPEVRALMLQALMGEAKKELELLKAAFSPRYELGTKLTFESPIDNALLGYVQRTRPKPEWQIVDRDAVVQHLAAEYPGVVEVVYALQVPGVSEPVMLPEDHELTQTLLGAAPHLLTPTVRVQEDAVKAALDETRMTGEPAAPGIKLVRPGGSLNVVYDKKEAIPAFGRMVRAGLIEWNGVAAIEAAEAAS